MKLQYTPKYWPVFPVPKICLWNQDACCVLVFHPCKSRCRLAWPLYSTMEYCKINLYFIFLVQGKEQKQSCRVASINIWTVAQHSLQSSSTIVIWTIKNSSPRLFHPKKKNHKKTDSTIGPNGNITVSQAEILLLVILLTNQKSFSAFPSS